MPTPFHPVQDVGDAGQDGGEFLQDVDGDAGGLGGGGLGWTVSAAAWNGDTAWNCGY